MDIDAVAGPVLRPDDPGYAEEIAAWNLATVHSPSIVVGATSADDVAAAVRYAAARNLRVAVQATGHGAAVAVAGGVLITTRRMAQLSIDPVRATARVAAGVKWRWVIDAAAPFGLAPLNGSSSDVGVVGYTLGGGMGLMARRYGFAADHVTWLQVVTADGRIREVDAEHDPDLFWALRGGKGNFGIVTAMEFRLVPVSSIYGGGIYYPASATSAVLHEYAVWSRGLPDEATASVALLRLPDMPFVPEFLRGQFVVHVRFAYLGDEAEGKRLLAPMRSVAPALADLVETMPYSQVDTIHMDPLDPVPAWDRGILLRELTADTVEAILATAGPQLDLPLIAVELRLMGGQLARQPAQPNAVSGRNAAYALHVIAPDVPGLTPVVRSAAAAVFSAVAAHQAEGALVNFLGDATASQVRAAYSIEQREWLLRIKEDYDPANLFAFGPALLSR